MKNGVNIFSQFYTFIPTFEIPFNLTRTDWNSDRINPQEACYKHFAAQQNVQKSQGRWSDITKWLYSMYNGSIKSSARSRNKWLTTNPD